MEVRSVFNSSLDDIDGICVAIGRPHIEQDQQHIGILFMDADAKPKFLHLAWHYDLRKDEPNDKYLWLDVPIDPINKIHLATVCALVFQSNEEGIPYGICIDGTGFAEDGFFTATEQYAGLTCATFVIQVFHSQNYFIVDFDKWEYKAEDKHWQVQILEALKICSASQEHINAQREKIQKGAARFKPEEVAAAAALPNQPHGREDIQNSANELLDTVVDHARRIAAMQQRH
jgi:hypothetical protein